METAANPNVEKVATPNYSFKRILICDTFLLIRDKFPFFKKRKLYQDFSIVPLISKKHQVVLPFTTG